MSLESNYSELGDRFDGRTRSTVSWSLSKRACHVTHSWVSMVVKCHLERMWVHLSVFWPWIINSCRSRVIVYYRSDAWKKGLGRGSEEVGRWAHLVALKYRDLQVMTKEYKVKNPLRWNPLGDSPTTPPNGLYKNVTSTPEILVQTQFLKSIS